MSTPALQELIQVEIAKLPENLAREVFDFILYLRDRQSEETFLWEQAEAAMAYQRAHPEDMIIMTAEEWEAATAPKAA